MPSTCSGSGSGFGFGFAPILFLSLVVACAARPLYPLPSKVSHGSRLPLQTSRPYNIAHRGSNGEIPEETSAAYMVCIGMQVNLLCNFICLNFNLLLCMSRVGNKFIVSKVTSIQLCALIWHASFSHKHKKEHEEKKREPLKRELTSSKLISCPPKMGFLYASMTSPLMTQLTLQIIRSLQIVERTYDVQGVNTTGFFTVDFTLKELKLLRVKQRFSFRDQQYNGKFPIITFEEFISIALDAPRIVGIYPEIKNPIFINQHVKWPGGKLFEDKFVGLLKKYGYKGSYLSEPWLKQPLFIQSFAPTSLVYISNLTDSPKIFLIDDITIPTQDTNQSYWEITSDAYLDYIKDYVVGIGPWKDTIVPVLDNYLQTPTDLVARAHSHDLQVHPYTFRNENQYLHFDFHQDPYEEYDYWINKIGVDGLFTDFTGSLHNFQEWTSPLSKDDGDDNSASKLLHQNRIANLVI
ncbi:GLYCEROPHOSPHODIESTER PHOSPHODIESTERASE GDPD6 [Salix koriyanagi]|uniref:glycerophosphodiester phosphodiesterase n=2 Tax=Salix koriyanagi TaxID=2511006 RepID=A0A9Q0SSX3_9ROSI|nr:GLYCEROPHOSPHODIESTER PHOSPHODIESTERASE GDPD6 [Salix koriyanagi]